MDLRILTFVLAGILIAMMLFKAIAKRVIYTNLQNYLAHDQYDEFFALIDKRLTHALYPDYNLNYFKLNAYLIRADYKKANEMLELLLKFPTNHKQRVDLVTKAFNIYIGQEMKKEARAMLDEIVSWEGDEYKAIKKDCIRTYDIVGLKKANHIEELQELLEKAQGPVRGRIEYFLALQYENLGDIDKRDEYLKRAADDSFTTPKKNA